MLSSSDLVESKKLPDIQIMTFYRLSYMQLVKIKIIGGLQLMKKETPTHAFSCEFCDIFKNTVFTEHL